MVLELLVAVCTVLVLAVLESAFVEGTEGLVVLVLAVLESAFFGATEV